MKQQEKMKNELVAKLKHELDTVEERFLKVINQNNMVGEDYRARCAQNYERFIRERLRVKELKEDYEFTMSELIHYRDTVPKMLQELEEITMRGEDYRSLASELNIKNKELMKLKEEATKKVEEFN